MSELASKMIGPAARERAEMHESYRRGGAQRAMAPHVVYQDADCPHGCGARLQAIDFRLEDHGKSVHDPLVLAWWADIRRGGPLPAMSAVDSLHHPRQTGDQRRRSHFAAAVTE